MVVYTLSTGSPDYIDWVKNQTEVTDSSESAFDDIKPEDLYKKDFGQAPEAGAMLSTKVEETAKAPSIKILQEAQNVQTSVNNNQEEDDDEDEEED